MASGYHGIMSLPPLRSRLALIVVTLSVIAVPVLAQQADIDSIPLLPYPDRITALKSPVNAAVAYGVAEERRFVNEIVWGPEKAPGLFRLHATGAIKIVPGDGGPIVELAREATDFTYGPKTLQRADSGSMSARITPLGGFRRIELRLPGLDSKAHRDQFAAIGTALIDGGRIPAFRRLQVRAGPDDSAGEAQERREKEARIDLLEAIQPMLGFVLDLPAGGVHSGTRLTVLRRDLGNLFRDAGPIPLRVGGEVVGLADVDGRRYLALKLDNADLTPPMQANIKGYALIDIETGLPETVIADIELIVLHGTDTSVFRFVERRALLPKDP